ncbi:MAG: rhamnulokinase [Rectinemataceae bacterium]
MGPKRQSFKGLAFDIGASHGRAILGILEHDKISLQGFYEFENVPLEKEGSIHWDSLALFDNLIKGIRTCAKAGHSDIDSMAVDTWGIDFGLLDDRGLLLDEPHNYRDPYSDGALQAISRIIPKSDLFRLTGVQSLPFNSIFQLFSLVRDRPDLIGKARKLLFMPDLFNYLLTGELGTEYSIVGTSQLLKIGDRKPCAKIFEAIGLSPDVMPDIVQCGNVAGTLKEKIAVTAGISRIPVVAVAEHDTQSAIVSIPTDPVERAYISCGTWSIMGIETRGPILTDDAFRSGFSNEIGLPGIICFSKLIPGLWVVQECRADWHRKAEDIDFETLEAMIESAEPFLSFINTEDDYFLAPGNMPERIKQFCASTSQPVPRSKGAIARCVLESLAMTYRKTLDDLERVYGHYLSIIHIVGGGSKNKTICRMAANAMHREVVAGPAEATSIGNILQQAIAIGKVADLEEARWLVSRSFKLDRYEPVDCEDWDAAYTHYRMVTAECCLGGVPSMEKRSVSTQSCLRGSRVLR